MSDEQTPPEQFNNDELNAALAELGKVFARAIGAYWLLDKMHEILDWWEVRRK